MVTVWLTPYPLNADGESSRLLCSRNLVSLHVGRMGLFVIQHTILVLEISCKGQTNAHSSCSSKNTDGGSPRLLRGRDIFRLHVARMGMFTIQHTTSVIALSCKGQPNAHSCSSSKLTDGESPRPVRSRNFLSRHVGRMGLHAPLSVPRTRGLVRSAVRLPRGGHRSRGKGMHAYV